MKVYREESSLTPQLKRKQYFEEKQELARRDVLVTAASLNAVKPKSKFVTIRHDESYSKESDYSDAKKSESAYENIAKIIGDETIMSKNRKEYCRRKSKLTAHEQNELNINYAVVERQPVHSVMMERKEMARKRLMEELSSRPQVKVLRKSEQNETPTDFYGPQLPISWVAEPKISAKKKGNRESSPDDSEDEFSREIESFLSYCQSEDSHSRRVKEETTRAFLKSSYAGSLRHKPAPRMEQKRTQPLRRHASSPPAEFLKPQLPQDWTERLSDAQAQYRSYSLMMSKSVGRDSVKIDRKGVVKKEVFAAPLRPSDHSPAPEPDSEPSGEGRHGASSMTTKTGVNMAKQVSRSEAIGPYGRYTESTAAVAGVEETVLQELLREEGIDVRDLGAGGGRGQYRLDIDAEAAAAEVRAKGHIDHTDKLYAKDRYVSDTQKKKNEEVEGEAGDWYVSFVDEARRRAVDFRHMTGREAVEEKEEALRAGDDLGLEFPREGRVLDLSEGVDRALQRRSDNFLVFADPHTFPRTEQPDDLLAIFDEEGVAAYREKALELSPKRVNESSRIPSFRMSAQRERWGETDEGLVEREVHGAVDRAGAVAVARETDARRAAGHELTSQHPRTPFLVAMDRDGGRPRDREDRELLRHETVFAEEASVHEFFDPELSSSPAKPMNVVGRYGQWDYGTGREDAATGSEVLRGEGLDPQSEGATLELAVATAQEHRWRRDPVPHFARQTNAHRGETERAAAAVREALLAVDAAPPGEIALDVGNPDPTLWTQPRAARPLLMSKALSRDNAPPVIDELVQEQEELDLRPDPTATSKYSRATLVRWRDPSVGESVLDTNSTLQQVNGRQALVLSPKPEALRPRSAAVRMNEPAVSDTSAVRDSLRQSLGVDLEPMDGQALVLEPDYDAIRKKTATHALRWGAESPITRSTFLTDYLRGSNASTKELRELLAAQEEGVLRIEADAAREHVRRSGAKGAPFAASKSDRLPGATTDTVLGASSPGRKSETDAMIDLLREKMAEQTLDLDAHVPKDSGGTIAWKKPTAVRAYVPMNQRTDTAGDIAPQAAPRVHFQEQDAPKKPTVRKKETKKKPNQRV